MDTDIDPIHNEGGASGAGWSGCVRPVGKRGRELAAGKNGYVPIEVNGKWIGAHRHALQVKLGRPLHPGMDACHSCDTRWCVNPNHLFEGTRAENMQDMSRKGGGRRKLTDGEAIVIRRFGQHVRHSLLAKVFGVARTTIQKIVAGDVHYAGRLA